MLATQRRQILDAERNRKINQNFQNRSSRRSRADEHRRQIQLQREWLQVIFGSNHALKWRKWWDEKEDKLRDQHKQIKAIMIIQVKERAMSVGCHKVMNLDVLWS